MQIVEPWTINPSFTEERLQLIASEIYRIRAELVPEQRPEKGDGPWDLGCKAHNRLAYALESLTLTGEHPWLSVHIDGLAYEVAIEGTPIKIHNGQAERPSSRSVQRGYYENLKQGRFDFLENELQRLEDGWFWMLAVEKNGDGSVLRIVVTQANGNGDVRNGWEVPLETLSNTVNPVVKIVREGVDLPPPTVGPKQAEIKLAGGENSGDDTIA